MAEAAQPKAQRSYAWGPLSALGLGTAIVTGIIDQASKLWLLDAFDLAKRGRVAVTPFLDLVVTWNTGISYGLFQQQGLVGALGVARLQGGGGGAFSGFGWRGRPRG